MHRSTHAHPGIHTNTNVFIHTQLPKAYTQTQVHTTYPHSCVHTCSQMRMLTHLCTLACAHLHVVPWDTVPRLVPTPVLVPGPATPSHHLLPLLPTGSEPQHLWLQKCKSLLPGHLNQLCSPQPPLQVATRVSPNCLPEQRASPHWALWPPLPEEPLPAQALLPPTTPQAPQKLRASTTSNKDPWAKVPSLGCRMGGPRLLCTPVESSEPPRLLPTCSPVWGLARASSPLCGPPHLTACMPWARTAGMHGVAPQHSKAGATPGRSTNRGKPG